MDTPSSSSGPAPHSILASTIEYSTGDEHEGTNNGPLNLSTIPPQGVDFQMTNSPGEMPVLHIESSVPSVDEPVPSVVVEPPGNSDKPLSPNPIMTDTSQPDMGHNDDSAGSGWNLPSGSPVLGPVFRTTSPIVEPPGFPPTTHPVDTRETHLIPTSDAPGIVTSYSDSSHRDPHLCTPPIPIVETTASPLPPSPPAETPGTPFIPPSPPSETPGTPFIPPSPPSETSGTPFIPPSPPSETSGTPFIPPSLSSETSGTPFTSPGPPVEMTGSPFVRFGKTDTIPIYWGRESRHRQGGSRIAGHNSNYDSGYHPAFQEPEAPFTPVIPQAQLPVTDHSNERVRHENALRWDITIYSQHSQIQQDQVRQLQLKRSTIDFESQLHDLLVGSLLPLSRQYLPHEVDKIKEQATLFFASFSSDANWFIDVKNLQPRVGQVINGLTVNSRNPSLEYRFFRFRFPYVLFEWFVETPLLQIASCSVENPINVETVWKAWARSGPAAGLVAYGSIIDTVRPQVLIESDHPLKHALVIIHRRFIVTQVFQPELMTPTPYPQTAPQFMAENDILIFSTSSTVIQFLRSSHIRLAFLVAVSALFASLQPIIGNFTIVGGWITAGIGVFSGLISLLVALGGWSLEWIERNAAKQQQLEET